MADSPHTDSIPSANNVTQLTPINDLIQALRSAWQRFLLDDLAHQIVVQADRPVLVVQTIG